MPRSVRLLAIAAPLALAAPAASADVVISSGATQNMSCSAGVCAPTANKAVLNIGDLETLLASGNVQVTTTGSGVQADNIDVSAALSWSSTSTLTLDANESIAVEKAVSVAGTGGVVLTTNDGGSDGTLSFGSKGHVTLQNLSSPLTINGTAYTLEDSVKTLANAVAANPSGSYALASSYNASQDGTYSNSPVGTTLTGTVQGLGNTISNLGIDYTTRRKAYIGLFALTGVSASIDSIRLTALNIKAHSGRAIGGLVALNQGSLFNDHVAGIIESPSGAGGVAGGNEGLVAYSSANVRIKALQGLAGGLVGDNVGTISQSSAEGSIKCIACGGLVGDNDTGSISESFATGKVTGGDQARVGGLVSLNDDNGEIENSYALGAVSAGQNSEVGGFIGENDSTVENSYSIGSVEGGTNSLVGGFSGGWAGAIFSDCYWDVTTSGTDQGTGGGNVSGITGLTTQQLQSGLPTGFDPKIWAENPKINSGLPYLINNPPVK